MVLNLKGMAMSIFLGIHIYDSAEITADLGRIFAFVNRPVIVPYHCFT